jgi:tetratricopeptide (TPR) repeat protein
MEKQQFLDKFEELKSPANAERWSVLQLWLVEAKSDGDIATDLGKDRSMATRKIGEICKHFGTNAKGKKEQRQHLILLFRMYCKDFEVHPSVYPDWVDGDLSDRPQPLTNPQNIPTPEPIPELTTLDFIGRDRDLTNLASRRNQYKIVLIKAGAGVGKSTLAREFLRTQFKKVIRIEMGLESGNVTPAEEKVSQILQKDFDEEPSQDFGINLDILRDKLGDRANPIGVLIDNLEPALDENYRFREKLRGYDALLAVLGDRDVFSFTLITSRRSLITSRAKVHEYPLEGLDIKAWRQYFYDYDNGTNSEALLQMRDAYNGNAKAMDILHGAIKNRFDGNIGAYWNRYKDALLADSELETLISVEMDWLRDNQPDAYKLLCRMGYYRYQDVKTVPFDGLICLLWDVPESQQFGVVEYLSKSSLLEVKGEYYLHPAIREASKLKLKKGSKDDYKRINSKAADFWRKRLKDLKLDENPHNVEIPFEAYYHYIEIEDFEKAGEVIVEPVDSESLLGSLFYRTGFSTKMIFAIKGIIGNVHNPYVMAKLYILLGDHYWAIGEIRESIKNHEQCRKIAQHLIGEYEQEPSPKNINELKKLETTAIFNIGLCKLWLGETEEAIEEFNQVPKMEDYPINNCTEWITSQVCLSFLSGSLQNLDDKKIVDNSKRWHSALRLLFSGLTYKKIGKNEKAYEYYRKCISYADDYKFKQIKGKALISQAEIERLRDNHNNALEKLNESIELLKRIEAKCDLAEAYFQLGLTYQKIRQYDEAEKHKVKALELFTQMEAPKQIERVNKVFGENIQ